MLKPTTPYANYAQSQDKNGPLPIYVDIRQGGPTGQIMSHLQDPRRARGLVVQAFGYPNEVPCRVCEKHFKSSESSSHAGMWPFFGCRSVPGQFGNDCGNCLFAVEQCSFREPRLHRLRARSDREPPIIEDVRPENSPCLKEYNGETLLKKVLEM